MRLDLKMWCILVDLDDGDFPHGASDDELAAEIQRLMRAAGRDPERYPGQYQDACRAARSLLDQRDGGFSLAKRLSMLVPK
jgi:hypothetical protein